MFLSQGTWWSNTVLSLMGLLGGHTRHLELTSIVLDGDHQEAYARAEVILDIAHGV